MEAAAVAGFCAQGVVGRVYSEQAHVGGGELGELAAFNEAAGLGLHVDIVAGAAVGAAIAVADGQVGFAVEVEVAHLHITWPQSIVVESELFAAEALREAAVAQGDLGWAHANQTISVAAVALHFGLPAGRQVSCIYR